MSPDRASRRPPYGQPSSRVWQAGFLIGAAIGVAATVAGRRIEHHARAAGLIDWDRVERVATARLRSAPGALQPWELQAAEPSYAAAMAKVVPALEAPGTTRGTAADPGAAG
ncbi:MAG TPA: hypothetical protein VIR16_04930, partial [Candidatus Limnocylindrales bacterium]